MNESRRHDDALARALRAVAEDDHALSASAGIEARLLTEALGITRARRRRTYATSGAFALLAVAVTIPLWRMATDRPSAPGAASATESARAAGVEDTTEFFPLMYSNVPITDARTVRLELPQSALTSFGLDADDPAGTVLADVVVGQDGLARAVRFVRPVIITQRSPGK